MERLRDRHYYRLLTVAFLCIITIMTSLSIVTMFAGAFPERLISFVMGPKWIVLFFYSVPFLLIFGIAHFSARFVDIAFNLFFHRVNVITHPRFRLLNRSWKLLLTSSFMTFASALIVIVGCANRIFYWRRRGDFNFSNWMMVGTILCYILALWSTYKLFIIARDTYISTQGFVQSIGSDFQHDPTILESYDPTILESSSNGTINADEDGFFLNDRYGNDFLEWSQIHEVRPYKREGAVDVVLGLNFLTEWGGWWKVRENMVGYHDLQSWLPRKLPGFHENWAEKALEPKFQSQRYILWKRDC